MTMIKSFLKSVKSHPKKIKQILIEININNNNNNTNLLLSNNNNNNNKFYKIKISNKVKNINKLNHSNFK